MAKFGRGVEETVEWELELILCEDNDFCCCCCCWLLLLEICVRRFIEGIERLAADLYIELELDRIWPWKIQSLQHEGLRDTEVSQEVAGKKNVQLILWTELRILVFDILM